MCIYSFTPAPPTAPPHPPSYAHVPKAERHKLDCKTRKCVLLGYGTDQKGYRLYGLGQMKVIHSRDVVFDETSMPGDQKEEESFPKLYVELEIEEEPVVEDSSTTGSSRAERRFLLKKSVVNLHIKSTKHASAKKKLQQQTLRN